MSSTTTTKEISSPTEQHISFNTIEDKITLYLDQLSPIEKIALVIAEEHLGTSFDLQKSNGFIEWCKQFDK